VLDREPRSSDKGGGWLHGEVGARQSIDDADSQSPLPERGAPWWNGVRRGYARIPGPGRPVGGARGLGVSAPPQGPHGGGARSAATGEEEESSQGREIGSRRCELGVD